MKTVDRVNRRWKLLHKKLKTDGGSFSFGLNDSSALITPAIGIMDYVCIDDFEIDAQKKDSQLDALLKTRLTSLYLDIIDKAREAIEKIAGVK